MQCRQHNITHHTFTCCKKNCLFDSWEFTNMGKNLTRQSLTNLYLDQQDWILFLSSFYAWNYFYLLNSSNFMSCLCEVGVVAIKCKISPGRVMDFFSRDVTEQQFIKIVFSSIKQIYNVNWLIIKLLMTATPGQLRSVRQDNKSPKDVNHIKAIRRCTPLLSSLISAPALECGEKFQHSLGWVRSWSWSN